MTARLNRAVAITDAAVVALFTTVAFAQSTANPATSTPSQAKPASTTPATQKPAPAKPATAKPVAVNPALRTPAKLKETAPATFRVNFYMSVGPFVVEVTRAWAPIGADCFYNLANRTATSTARASSGLISANFMVQFGIHGDPKAETPSGAKRTFPTIRSRRATSAAW